MSVCWQSQHYVEAEGELELLPDVMFIPTWWIAMGPIGAVWQEKMRVVGERTPHHQTRHNGGASVVY